MVGDRDAKENVEPVGARAVLDKVAELSLATWNYKAYVNDLSGGVHNPEYIQEGLSKAVMMAKSVGGSFAAALSHLVAALEPPRSIWVMIPAAQRPSIRQVARMSMVSWTMAGVAA